MYYWRVIHGMLAYKFASSTTRHSYGVTIGHLISGKSVDRNYSVAGNCVVRRLCTLSRKSLIRISLFNGTSYKLHRKVPGYLTPCGSNKSGSTLVHAKAYCLTTPSYYLSQCWLIIREVPWHSAEINFTNNTQATYFLLGVWKISMLFNIRPNFQMGQWVNKQMEASSTGGSWYFKDKDPWLTSSASGQHI